MSLTDAILTESGGMRGLEAASNRVREDYLPVVKVATLTDTFDSAIDKTVKWKDTSAAVVWDTGRVKIPVTTSYWALQSGLSAGQAYDLTASAFYGKVTVPAVGAGSKATMMSIFQYGATPFANKIWMSTDGNYLTAYTTAATVDTSRGFVAYNATSHAWWRIREATGTVYYETSPDGTTWTSFATAPAPSWANRVAVGFTAGYWGTESASDAYIDNVNTPETLEPVYFTDNFNRADGALGSGWTTTAGSVVINTNKAVPTTGSNDSVRAVTPGISNNQWAEGYITAADTYSWLVVRGNADDSSRYSFISQRSTDGGKWILTRSVSGSDTDIATGANGSGVTGLYRVEAEGTTIRCYINGTKVAEVTDALVTTGGIGFGFYTTGAGGSVDNFRGGDLPYSPPPPIVPLAVWDAGSLVASNGDPIGTWQDSGTNDLDATASGTSRPTYVASGFGGRPALSFDGVDDHFVLPAGFSTWTAGLTWFIVAKPTTVTNGGKILTLSNGADNQVISISRNASNTSGTWFDTHIGGATGYFFTDNNWYVPNEGAIYSCHIPAGAENASVTGTVRKNNTVWGSGSMYVPPVIARGANYIGRSVYGGDVDWAGEISEIRLYNVTLSDEDRDAIYNELYAKYVGHNMFGSSLPTAAAVSDSNPVQLATMFYVTEPGTITRLRCPRRDAPTQSYKGYLYNGTSGALLGEVVFPTGAFQWVEAALPTPVAVVPGQLYCVAYWKDSTGTDNPYYVGGHYFDTIVNVPKFSLPPGSALANGRFRYQGVGTADMPVETYNNNCYFADVVFRPSVGYRTFTRRDYVDLAIAEEAGVALNGYTAAALVRHADFGETNTWMSMVSSDVQTRWYVYIGTAGPGSQEVDAMGGSYANDGINAATNVSPVGEWYIVAVSRAAGTGNQAVRFHKYRFSTGVWTHVGGSAPITQSAAVDAGGFIRLGAPSHTGESFGGDIAAALFERSVLTDVQIESLPKAFSNWAALADHAWRLDAATVVDAVGNCDQGAIDGAPLGSGSSPLPALVTPSAAVLVTDNFNRPNAATWGANWSVDFVTASILNSMGRLEGSGAVFHVTPAATTNQFVEVDFNMTASAGVSESFSGIICANGSWNTGYWLQIADWAVGSVVLMKNNTQVASVGGAWPSEGTYRFRIQKRGGDIMAFVNGVLILTWNDGTPLTGTRFGLGINFDGGTCDYDNFVGGDL